MEFDFQLIKVNLVMEESNHRMSASWHIKSRGKWKKKEWKAALFCIFWTIWWQQNRILFDGEKLNIHILSQIRREKLHIQSQA